MGGKEYNLCILMLITLENVICRFNQTMFYVADIVVEGEGCEGNNVCMCVDKEVYYWWFKDYIAIVLPCSDSNEYYMIHQHRYYESHTIHATNTGKTFQLWGDTMVEDKGYLVYKDEIYALESLSFHTPRYTSVFLLTNFHIFVVEAK